MSDQNFNESMLDVFIFETAQLIEQLEETILSSEKVCCYSKESIDTVFRIMHTIKGSSAMMMYTNISSLAHAIEDLFYFVREEKPQNVDFSLLTDLILDCIDFLKVELEKIKNGDAPDGEYSELIEQIDKYLTKLKQGEIQSKHADMLDCCDDVQDIEEQKDTSKINIFKAIVQFEEDCQMENIRAFSVVRDLKKYTSELCYYPEDVIDNDECCCDIRKNGFCLAFKTDSSYEQINHFFMKVPFQKHTELKQEDSNCELKQLVTPVVESEHELTKSEKETIESEKEPIKSAKEIIDSEKQTDESEKEPAKSNSTLPNEKDTKVAPSKDAENCSTQQSMISVNVTKLDKLMDLVGEMVIAEAMVIQNSDLKGLVLNNFYKSARQLDKITNEIQDIVMSIRMVSLSTTFHKMHRIVRDMCKKLGKEVELKIIGEDTEVDKNIIEHISDPLMHLVRNALDHGIETPKERLAKGKSSVGRITLIAKNVGSEVLVIIKDDGHGLDKNLILDKARKNNLLYKPVEDMLDKEIYSMIFLPGFSTKEAVSEFSGRGVGMDVVSRNIEMVGGSISVESIYGQGTTITLKIPLTLAIIDGMNIKVGNSHYTIPTTSVKEFFRPKEKDIISDSNLNEMIMVRGNCHTILRLNELFDVKNAKTKYEEGIIIMIEQDDKSLCIFADELLGQQQVVVKSLPEYILKFKKIKGLAGCTLLGDGNISLILDIPGLMGR